MIKSFTIGMLDVIDNRWFLIEPLIRFVEKILITTKAQLDDKLCWCNMLISNAFMSFGVFATSNVCEKYLLMHNKISPFGRGKRVHETPNDRESQNMSKIYAELYW